MSRRSLKEVTQCDGPRQRVVPSNDSNDEGLNAQGVPGDQPPLGVEGLNASTFPADQPTNHTAEAEHVRQRKEALRKKLGARRYNHDNPPERPLPVLFLGVNALLSPGNLMVVQAGIKAGKSAATGGIFAAQIVAASQDDGKERDTLGFSASPPEGKAVVHFDTEQDPCDHDQLVRRSLRRAGVQDVPEWFESYCLTDCERIERLEMLRLALEDAEKRHGGLHLVVLDGVADLCLDVNNIQEANSLVSELHRLAIQYQTGIICVLHENPGTEKTRGHLGSELARKAETNLRLAKDKDGVTTVWADYARHCFIPKEQGICFNWNDELKAHALCGGAAERLRDAKREESAPLALAVWEGIGGFLTYKELVAAIMAKHRKAVRTAKEWVKAWKNCGVLEQDGSLYKLASWVQF